MTMITPSYLGETIEYSSLHACRSTLEDPTPKRFQAFADGVRDSLGMKEDQRKKLDEIDKELIAKLDKILTAEQIKRFAEPIPSDAADFSNRPPGEYLLMFNRSTPKVTDAQRKELQALQKDFSPRITKIFNDAQKTLIADFKKGQIAAAAGRGAPPKQGNTLFRATRYALNHPAFAGRTLKPGKTLVELQQAQDKPQPNKETNSAKLKTVDASK